MVDTRTKKTTPSVDTIGTTGEIPPTKHEETMKTETTPDDDAVVEKLEDSSPPTKQEELLSKRAINIEEMTRGMVYASLAITDDKEDTLKKVGLLFINAFTIRYSVVLVHFVSHYAAPGRQSESLAN